MAGRSYHHGNLRAVLLQDAEELLRSDGADALSLREIARRAGVSHGAPRAHFVDRQALLDALAVRGFERLAEAVLEALEADAGSEDRFRRVAHAYVRFAVDDAALMEHMFRTKVDDPHGEVGEAAGRLFRLLDEAIGPDTGSSRESRQRFGLLFAATMQGAASLITTRRVTPAQGRQVVDDATDVLLRSHLAAEVVADL